MLPPGRPPRASMHDCERHDRTLRATLTAKLSRLRDDVSVGSGQRPRSSVAPMRRQMHAVLCEHLLDCDVGLQLF